LWRLIPIAGSLLVGGLIAWWLRGALAEGRIATRTGYAYRNRQPGAFWFSIVLMSSIAALFVLFSVLGAAMMIFSPSCASSAGAAPCHY
jgi:hypothetical protein